MNEKTRFRLETGQRTTFTLQSRNQSNVLLPVVSLFDELNVGIDAIYMIRRKDAENVRINVTVQIDQDSAGKIEDRLTNVHGVLSVRTEIGRKDVLHNSPGDEATR